MIFPDVKVLLFVSLIVAAVMKSECYQQEHQEDVKSDIIKKLAKFALEKLNRTFETGNATEVTVIKNASTRYDPAEITTLSMEVCPTSQRSSDQCELCQVQMSRINSTDSYQLDAAQSSCQPIPTSGGGGGNGIIPTEVQTSGSTIMHFRVFYVIPIVVLSQIHKILSLL